MVENPNRLLIVDANRSIREYFAVIGQKANYDVAKAIDESEMRRKMSTFSPTVIMLGVHEPASDTTNKLKLLNDLKSEAKIILLCDTDWRNLQNATNLGQIMGLNMSGSMQKPVSIDVVRDMLVNLRNRFLDANTDKFNVQDEESKS